MVHASVKLILSCTVDNRPKHKINNHLSISCNIFDITMEYNHWLALVVVIDRLVQKITSLATSCLRYKIYMYVLCLKQLPIFAS